GENRFIFTVEFIAMAVALTDLRGGVSFGGLAVGLQLAGPGAQAHGAAQLVNAGELAQLIDDAVRSGLIELAGVGLIQATDVARVFDAGGLHAQADAEIRNFFLTRVANAVQHALNAALAEAARYQDAVKAFELHLVIAI